MSSESTFAQSFTTTTPATPSERSTPTTTTVMSPEASTASSETPVASTTTTATTTISTTSMSESPEISITSTTSTTFTPPPNTPATGTETPATALAEPDKKQRGNKGWAVGGKKLWLESYLPAFRQAVTSEDKKVKSRFYDKISRFFILKYGWDLPYNEDAAEDLDDPDDTMLEGFDALIQDSEEGCKRKKYLEAMRGRLCNWFRYANAKIEKPTKPEDVQFSLLAVNAPVKPRKRLPWQQYSKTYYESRVKAHYEAEWAAIRNRPQVEGESRPSSVAFRTAIIKKIFDSEPRSLRQTITREADEEYDTAMNEYEEALQASKAGPAKPRTPQERLRLLNSIYAQLQVMLDSIARQLDMVATLMLAGPAPDRGGAVELVYVHSGATPGLVQQDWTQFDGAAFEAAAKSLIHFARQIYTDEMCAKYALPNTSACQNSVRPLHLVPATSSPPPSTAAAPSTRPVQPAPKTSAPQSSTSGSGPSTQATKRNTSPFKPSATTSTTVPTSLNEPMTATATGNVPFRAGASMSASVSMQDDNTVVLTAGATFNAIDNHGPIHIQSSITSPVHRAETSPSRDASPAIPNLSLVPCSPGRSRTPSPSPFELPNDDGGGSMAVQAPTNAGSPMRPFASREATPVQGEGSTNLGKTPIAQAQAPNRDAGTNAQVVPLDARDRAQASSLDALKVDVNRWPKWLLNAVDFFMERDIGTVWTSCVAQYVAFERGAGFIDKGKSLSSSNRPALVGQWVKSARPCSLAWSKLNDFDATEFGGEWRTWWDGISDVAVPGVNGLLSVMVGLAWWGMKARDDRDRVAEERWRRAVLEVLQKVKSVTSQGASSSTKRAAPAAATLTKESDGAQGRKAKKARR